MILSVIIPTYNGRHLLEATLGNTIEKLTHPDHPIQWIVADDASTDDSIPWLTHNFPEIQIVTSPKNRGFAGTVSTAATHATGTHLLFLNNDMSIQSWDWTLLEPHFSNPDCFAVTPQIRRPSKNNAFESYTWGKFQGGWFSAESYVPSTMAETPLSDQPILWACGGAMVVSRDKYESLGGFDTLFSPFYFEDMDLSYRAWKRGWTCHYLDFALIHHQHQATIGRLFTKAHVDHIHLTHHYLFMWKNVDDLNFKIAHWLTVFIKIMTFQIGDIRAIWDAAKRLRLVIGYRRQRATPRISDREILERITPSAPHDPLCAEGSQG